jgi:hypothetical protein
MAEDIQQTPRWRTRHWLNISLVLIIVLAAIAGSLLVTTSRNKNASDTSPVRLAYVDSADGLATLMNNSGETLTRTQVQKNSYVTLEALSPDGNALLSINSPSPTSGFVMLDGSNKKLSEAAVKALRTADFQGGSHHFVFTDSQTVAFVVCPEGGTCKLVSLDLVTAKNRTVLDTGLTKQASTSYSYILGKAPDAKTVFLRVAGKNTIGEEQNAVYQVSLASGKSSRTIKVPQTAGYSLSLSADGKRLVYQTIEAAERNSSRTTFNVIDVLSGKQNSAKWSKFGINDQSGSLQWSPDSTKVLFRTGTVRFPTGSQNQPMPIYMAYLDVDKRQVIDLQTVSQTDRTDIISYDWLDNETVIYDQQTTDKPGDFSAAKNSSHKLEIKTKAVSRFSGVQAELLQPSY